MTKNNLIKKITCECLGFIPQTCQRKSKHKRSFELANTCFLSITHFGTDSVSHSYPFENHCGSKSVQCGVTSEPRRQSPGDRSARSLGALEWTGNETCREVTNLRIVCTGFLQGWVAELNINTHWQLRTDSDWLQSSFLLPTCRILAGYQELFQI